MPDKKKQPRKARVILVCLLSVFAILVTFYQPIVFALVRFAAGQVARSQAIDLAFEIHGSLFSDLFIENLHLQPHPENKALPLERLDAQRIAARYNLLNLLRKDYLNVVDLLELKNIDVIVRPAPSAPPQKPGGPVRFAVVLPKRIDIRNINLTVKNDTGDLQLQNFDLQFEQGKAGYLACETLRIPGIDTWNRLRAGLSYTKNRLALRDLELAPILAIKRLQLDLSASEQGTFRIGMDAKALGSSVLANVSYEQPPQGRILDANLNIRHFELAELHRLAPVSLTGSVPELSLQIKGDINRPRTLSGQVTVAAERVGYQNFGVDRAQAALTMQSGSGTISESVHAGANELRANATFTLSENMDSIVGKTVANIGLAASIPDPGKNVPGLKAPTIILGSIGIADGRARAVLRTFSSDISMPDALPGASVSAANAELFAVAKIPLTDDLWSSVAAIVLAGADKISYQDAHIAQLRTEAGLIDGATAAGNVRVRSGGSRIDISAHTPLPQPSAGFDPNRATVQLNLDINSITDFITQELVKGSLAAHADVQIAGGQANGIIRAAGSELHYKGINLHSLQVDALLKDGDANIQKFQIDLDPNNSVQMSGSAKLTEPFPFHALGTLAFKDLGVLNGILQNVGAQPGISGELSAQFSGDGDIHQPTGQLQVMGNGLNYRGFVLQNVAVAAAVKDSTATIERCRLSLDPNNYVNIYGIVGLNELYPYKASAQVRLPVLGHFNELLKDFGLAPGLSGVFNLDLLASGDTKNPTATIQ